MKHSDKKSGSLIYLSFFTSLALIVPNVWLDISEQYISVIGKIINVFLPFSFYLFLTTVFRRSGWGTIASIPFMVFAAFQIVLLYLYGESIIAVDMFLNVVTTDFEEATTLLGNLAPAIVFVCIIYLPVIVWGIIAVVKHWVIPHYTRLVTLSWSSLVLVISGILLLITSLNHHTVPDRDIFPVNVINNICLAVKRDRQARLYPQSADAFKYDAVSNDSTKKIIAIIIGETARPDRWEIFGAKRPTNPKLSKRNDLILFENAITQSNTTHKSVPMLLTPLTSENFNELNNYKSIITAFKEAGYQTSWLSNQPPNGAYNEHIGYEADTTLFYKYISDLELVKKAGELLASRDTTKSQLIVLHTYGAHFPYSQRYEGIAPTFTPDAPMMAKKDNRDALLNAYDNATIVTDAAIDSFINVIDRLSPESFMIYAADHGEDIFDDYRNKFLHASPAPTYYQLRVPMFIWASESLAEKKNIPLKTEPHRKAPVSPAQVIFHTVLDVADISTPYMDSTRSLISDDYKTLPLMYLTDRNENVPLASSGLRKIDTENFEKDGIDISKE